MPWKDWRKLKRKKTEREGWECDNQGSEMVI